MALNLNAIIKLIHNIKKSNEIKIGWKLRVSGLFNEKWRILGYRENSETIRRIYGISIVSAYAIVWPWKFFYD